MNFFNAKASYEDFITLFLDISPKDDTVTGFFFEGPKDSTYSEEFLELKDLVLGKKITDLKFLSRSNLHHEHKNIRFQKTLSSLSLTLLKEAILQYLGENKTFPEEEDLLCLCFGVTKKDIVNATLVNKDFDLKTLIQTTRATSACGTCKPLIEDLISRTRLQYGLIKGLGNSRARQNQQGQWIKIAGLYPGALLIMIDDYKNEWMKREEVLDQFNIEFINIEGHHLDVQITSRDGRTLEQKQKEGFLSAFSEFLKSKTGVLFFLHAL